MRFKDKFRFVRQNMGKNKTRVFMTVLATAMGCAFLIVLASVGFGLQRSVIEEITGGRLLTDINVYGKKTDQGYVQLNGEDIAQLKTIKNVKAVSSRFRVKAPVEYELDQAKATGQPIVIDTAEEIKAGFELETGRMAASAEEIVVGYNFAETLSSDTGSVSAEKLVGKTIVLKLNQPKTGENKLSIPVTIVGIAKKPTREWMQDSEVYIGEQVYDQMKEAAAEVWSELIGQQTGDNQAPANEQAVSSEQVYEEVHVFATEVNKVEKINDQLVEAGYSSHSIVNEMKDVNTFFLVLKIGLIFVGTIAILIASIGIYNTMTMAVTERAQDIGIMKAIGAHPSTIKNIFLIESSYIGLMGAALGTIVAYIISYLSNLVLPFIIREFMDKTPPEGLEYSYIPISLTVLCIAISLIVAVLSGMRPARRATQVDVLKALRRDI